MSIFLIKALTSLTQESSTWDETSYLGLGKYILQHHKWDVSSSILHPPLSYYVHDLPLLFFETDESIWKPDPSRVNDIEYLGASATFRGREQLSSAANLGDRMLNWSRFMMVLTAMLLGWFVYKWSYSLYGKWSAMLAIVLYSFCPNILANARLITPDITLATFTFLSVYGFWRLLRSGRLADAIWGGICFGLALLSKYSSLLLLPVFLALILIWVIKHKRLNLYHCSLYAAIGVTVLFLGYGMDLHPYFQGIAYQQKHAAEGHPTFLMGTCSMTGWWSYYTLAFLVKTPIVTMVLILMAWVLYLRKIPEGKWVDELFLLFPAAIFFCFFSLKHMDIGLRYVLPAYPFLFVFASQAAQSFLKCKLRIVIGVAAMIWYVGASCYIHPHYLAYFNELIGGPRNGYKYLADSNLDWGQDLKGLKKFMQENKIPKIYLSYFGTDSPARYGIDYNWLPSFELLNPDPQKVISPKGWVAISATCLQGVYFTDTKMYEQFKRQEPIATIGYSIFIYKLPD